MPPLAAGLDYVDLNFLGRPEIIATAILHGPAGVALIDPGPSTTLGNLTTALTRKGIRFEDVRQILITHIHLDHSGAIGSILAKFPHIEVVVHQRGAPHLIDPTKLLASAGRLYQQDMERLWGEVEPVDQARLKVIEGGERLTVVGREIETAYTPGHASHHVSYFDPASGVAFVGDTAGICRGTSAYVMPPTPPPDIDLDAWHDSSAKILSWDSDTLFLTHFGPRHGARQHLQAMFENVDAWSRSVKRLLADQSVDDAERQRRFVAEAFLEIERKIGETDATDYVRAGGLNYSYQGLARYWKKRQG
ncbi:MAG TPA: MBL fold metallo-hydrolase [Vicinamibacterales bacterium]|jgi:glyoxylase-like metal-dependent hydrolase (beta-lactamase superfamily II)